MPIVMVLRINMITKEGGDNIEECSRAALLDGMPIINIYDFTMYSNKVVTGNKNNKKNGQWCVPVSPPVSSTGGLNINIKNGKVSYIDTLTNLLTMEYQYIWARA